MVPLLDKAMEVIPPELYKNTPIHLKATAGLRMVEREKADAILAAVCLA